MFLFGAGLMISSSDGGLFFVWYSAWGQAITNGEWWGDCNWIPYRYFMGGILSVCCERLAIYYFVFPEAEYYCLSQYNEVYTVNLGL